ncbi:MAG: hypothetical protein EXR79_08340 [Myxococcales bacterium]|nr:hypothetical protein [Myxococcales bacterium]
MLAPVLVGATVLAGPAACGAARPHVVELDPIELKADRSGTQLLVYVRDFSQLVEEAGAKMAAGESAEAARLYDLAVAEFPDRPGVYAVRYNAGLCWLKVGRPDLAADRFADAMQRAAGTRHARDALFLYAEALDAAERPADAARVYRGALDDPGVQASIGGPLGLLDELEATARAGIAFRRAQDSARADEAFKRVERLYQDHRDVQLVAESEWVARALYERGEIYRELFAGIRFKLPIERMKRDLEDKANLFLKAESAYFHGVRLHHRTWSIAAGYEIGNLYQRLIEDIETAEVPDEVTGTLVDEYRDELWNHTEGPAKRALIIYRKNIDLCKQLGEASSDWAARSEAGLRRMEELIETATERRARLIQDRATAAGVAPTPASGNPTTAAPGPLGKGRRRK